MGTVLELDRFRTLETVIDTGTADTVTITAATDITGATSITGATTITGDLKIPSIAGGTTYADDAAAGVGGLVAGDVYAVTTSGLLAVKL